MRLRQGAVKSESRFDECADRHVNPLTTPNASTNSMARVEFNLRYPGQHFDKESNLSYNDFRSYRSQDGRYTQADPIGLEGGWNRFGYVGGNALSYTDPTGELPFLPIIVLGAQTAWGAYQGYRAVDAFNEAQCADGVVNNQRREGEGPTPSEVAAQNAKTFSNGASASGQGAAKALAGLALSGVSGKVAGTFAAGAGFAAGAFSRSQQSCTCK
jgi:RHS repeat-associated protein